MRTFIYNISLVTAAIFSMAACQKATYDTEESATVFRICADIPAETSLKAAGDAAEIDILHYEVWDEDYSDLALKGSEVVTGQSVTLELKLVRNQIYNIILWAQNSTSATYTWDNLKEIRVSYKDNGAEYTAGNMETRDAFYAVSKLNTNNLMDKYITLHRPFSQLNFFADDMEDCVLTDYAIKVKGLADVFDTISGEGKIVNEAEYSFKASGVFSDTDIVHNGVSYAHVAMNYILLPGKAETYIDLTATFRATKNGNDITTNHEIKYVSAKMNERINIYGSLVTE